MRYNVFKDQVGTRVIEESSGLHGTVVQIKETAYEWIEPIVKFDDEETPRQARGILSLEQKDA